MIALIAVAYVFLMLAINYVFDRPRLANLDQWNDYLGPALAVAVFGVLRFGAATRDTSRDEIEQISE